MDSKDEITSLLEEIANGREGAFDEIMVRVYGDLERLAEKHMRRQFGAGMDRVTLEPAGLVHEMFLRLVRQRNRYANRAQFFAIATKLMLRSLVDYRRAREAKKRGGGEFRVTLTGIAAADPAGPSAEPVVYRY
jgi:DNA-directed RNA polymerase specialized sigma24 family protein